MTEKAILADRDEWGVVTVTFNRPHVNNAYNDEFIQGVLDGLDMLEEDAGLRAVVLRGNGRHFQAGADLKWINSVRPGSRAANREASRKTAAVIDRLNNLPVPVVALVQGGCFGGGTGVISACDVVIAADNAIFSISEVRWGLHAAIIVPHLNDAIGVRQVRRYALTGERFDATEARRIGLVHEVVALDKLEARGAEIVSQILENSTSAMAFTKQHILESAWGGLDQSALDYLIDSHAAARQSADAAEGLASFAEKRQAAWAPKK
ncbi:MAG: enoyl-CoA hydratase-related protein [Hyphomicrobiaceae bacterium]